MNYGYAVMFTGLAVLAAVYVYDLVQADKVRRVVFTNLDSVLSGDQFSDGYLHGATALEIAGSMELYCEDASGYDRNELLPHVERWMREHGL